jgi:uncharacterized membrane protein
MTRRWPSLMALGLLSCGGGSSNPTTPPTVATPTVLNGCPSLEQPVAQRGENIGGDTYPTYARGFFAMWCLRCHSSTLTTPAARNGAPEGLNWDVEASVRANLTRIRTQVGVLNTMPLLDPRVNDPLPSCDERRRLVRWIDAGAP